MRRATILLAAFLPLLASLAGCTYTASVAQTNIPRDRSRQVAASVTRYIVLGFKFDNDNAFELPAKLRAKCPDGHLRGILTDHSRTFYLLFFFWSENLEARAYCLRGKRGRAETEAEPTDATASGKPGDGETLTPIPDETLTPAGATTAAAEVL